MTAKTKKPVFLEYVAYSHDSGDIILARSEKFRRDVGLGVLPICRDWKGIGMRAWFPDFVRVQPDRIITQAPTFIDLILQLDSWLHEEAFWAAEANRYI
jgi:hypothetical protein